MPSTNDLTTAVSSAASAKLPVNTHKVLSLALSPITTPMHTCAVSLRSRQVPVDFPPALHIAVSGT